MGERVVSPRHFVKSLLWRLLGFRGPRMQSNRRMTGGSLLLLALFSCSLIFPFPVSCLSSPALFPLSLSPSPLYSLSGVSFESKVRFLHLRTGTEVFSLCRLLPSAFFSFSSSLCPLCCCFSSVSHIHDGFLSHNALSVSGLPVSFTFPRVQTSPFSLWRSPVSSSFNAVTPSPFLSSTTPFLSSSRRTSLFASLSSPLSSSVSSFLSSSLSPSRSPSQPSRSPSQPSSSVSSRQALSVLRSHSSRLSPTHAIAGLASPVRVAKNAKKKSKKRSSSSPSKPRKNSKQIRKPNPHLPPPPPAVPTARRSSPSPLRPSSSTPSSSTPSSSSPSSSPSSSFVSRLPPPWLLAALRRSPASAKKMFSDLVPSACAAAPLGLPIPAALSVLKGSALVRLPAGRLRPSLVSGVRFLGSFGLPSLQRKTREKRESARCDGEAWTDVGEAWTGLGEVDEEPGKPRNDAARGTSKGGSSGAFGSHGDTLSPHETRRERKAAKRAQAEQCEGTEGDDERPEGVQVVDILQPCLSEDEEEERGENENENGEEGEGEEGEGEEASASTDLTRVSLRARLLQELALPSLGLPEVAFLGRSNVGKSSLLNALCLYTQKKHRGRTRLEMARVSRRPGSTRSINLYEAFGGCASEGSLERKGKRSRTRKSTGHTTRDRQLPRKQQGKHPSGVPLTATGNRGLLLFADLPGYGFARGLSGEESQQLSKNVRLYVEKRNELRLFLVLVDGRLGLQDHDAEMLRWLAAQSVPTLLVVTKADCLGAKDLENLLNQLSFYPKLFSLPPILKRLQGTRGEPEAVRRFNFVSPALLSAARVSDKGDAETPEGDEEPGSERPKAKEEKPGKSGRTAETTEANGAAAETASLQDERLKEATGVLDGGETAAPQSMATEKRVGIMHGLEGEEGRRLREREEKEKRKDALRALPAIDGFRAPGKRDDDSEAEGPIQVLLTSAATGQGIAELWRKVCDACSGVRTSDEDSTLSERDGEREDERAHESGKLLDGKEGQQRKIRKKDTKKEPFWGFGM
ncbi:putative GTP-binding protein engB [Toxoplasma gondii GAB2-2007-GAL-DOM2]|uniref:GTP-binding conserved hypothetical domain-containing protein n=3 Tax=Toxoplasma gondii TaxID=5811 RepID=V4ZDF9_TOXGV|nr:putative GTP-binding protein engB [Toxoplasma gondii VEG]KFG35201.1 putative GTP-binding protein engB [Toxoplasma gondii p89]KFG49596.1 putative GTP-binding protein engB [Toxoplasma gondii GAB2-2007-GAL-DOM2]CEL74196.1 TPA: GTP-binding conserved hypothetical domain-containing protein [Toxoplasma gondii VEG]